MLDSSYRQPLCSLFSGILPTAYWSRTVFDDAVLWCLCELTWNVMYIFEHQSCMYCNSSHQTRQKVNMIEVWYILSSWNGNMHIYDNWKTNWKQNKQKTHICIHIFHKFKVCITMATLYRLFLLNSGLLLLIHANHVDYDNWICMSQNIISKDTVN